MSRNTEYQFVPTDPEEVLEDVTRLYEEVNQYKVSPASPDKLHLCWLASILVQERSLENYIGNQNLLSRAEGENLDALGGLCRAQERPRAKPARCTERFFLSQAQRAPVWIAAGTRVTDAGGQLVWETVDEACIQPGETRADVELRCQTPGTAGNGFAPGQLNKLVDLYDYCAGCSNLTATDGGADAATDQEYYELLRQSMDAFSCAGAIGGYIYWAKQVSVEIADVAAVSPAPGTVKLYVLMDNGEPAGAEIKQAVLAACSAAERRPLTDQVSVEDAAAVGYDIRFTYYLQEGSGLSTAQAATAVEAAVQDYIAWQRAKLGRDINPSRLLGLLMQTGIKRVELTAPAFQTLRDGSGGGVPQVAAAGTVAAVCGGYEHE
ncbi:MAG: phage baseplate protein [Oscillospiraceae bacterium]|nr:phage baseplate protein [Oscillospiraceae bacterium]